MKRYWVYRYYYTFQSGDGWSPPREVQSVTSFDQYEHVSDKRLSPEEAIKVGELQLSYFWGFNFLARWEEEEQIVTTHEVTPPERGIARPKPSVSCSSSKEERYIN